MALDGISPVLELMMVGMPSGTIAMASRSTLKPSAPKDRKQAVLNLKARASSEVDLIIRRQ